MEGTVDREPYARFKYEEMILRDFLAADRTVFANERTFLAYLRPALAFGIGGASLVQFFTLFAADIIGWALMLCGILTMLAGIYRFTKTKRRLDRVINKLQA